MRRPVVTLEHPAWPTGEECHLIMFASQVVMQMSAVLLEYELLVITLSIMLQLRDEEE